MGKENGRLPSRQTLLDVLKRIEVPNEWQGVESAEVRELEREANRIRAELLRNPKLIAIEKKVAKLKAAKVAKNKEARKRKADMIVKVKLAEITPQIVAEVRKLAGVSA